MDLVEANLAWLREEFVPRNVDAEFLYIAFHDLDRRSKEGHANALNGILLYGHVVLHDLAFPFVDHYIFTREVLEQGEEIRRVPRYRHRRSPLLVS